MDIVAVLMDFQGLKEIASGIVVSVLKLFVCRKRKKEEKVYVTGVVEVDISAQQRMQMTHVYSVCLSVFEKVNCWSPVVGTRTPNKTKSGSIPSKTGGAPGRAMERKG